MEINTPSRSSYSNSPSRPSRGKSRRKPHGILVFLPRSLTFGLSRSARSNPARSPVPAAGCALSTVENVPAVRTFEIFFSSQIIRSQRYRAMARFPFNSRSETGGRTLVDRETITARILVGRNGFAPASRSRWEPSARAVAHRCTNARKMLENLALSAIFRDAKTA